jgi:thiol-disulfide isomerase/thioredoxin
MKKIYLLFFCFSIFFVAVNGISQQKASTKTEYRALLHRNDKLPIVFNIAESKYGGKRTWTIRNAAEKLVADRIIEKGDSLLVYLPFFDGMLLLKKSFTGYEGIWNKKTIKGDQFMPLTIERGSKRLDLSGTNSKFNVTGRWKVEFINPDLKRSIAMGEFKQIGSKLTGTFLTPTGDYRFLEGTIAGDSLQMTTFDGSHAFFFSAHIKDNNTLESGIYASGPTYMEKWTANRDEKMILDESSSSFQLKGKANKLDFSFPDLDSNIVSMADERFKNKVVVIQIMGSWCPNCMDETAFLSNFFDENKQHGVEVIGLAYEYSKDFSRSKKSLSYFKNRFNVKYPILITGITSSDEMKTEKTLPQMTEIKAFPSMIFIGRDGTVRKTHAGYAGPATGIHHELFKKEFSEIVEALLAEK